MAGFLFRLETPEGAPAEPPTLQTAVPNWRPGDTIPLGGATLHVVDVPDDRGVSHQASTRHAAATTLRARRVGRGSGSSGCARSAASPSATSPSPASRTPTSRGSRPRSARRARSLSASRLPDSC
jgi:hypothetical protein